MKRKSKRVIERNDNGNIVLHHNQETFILCPMTMADCDYFQICNSEYEPLIEYIPEMKTDKLVFAAEQMLRAYHLGLRRGIEMGHCGVINDIKRILRIT